MEEKKKTFSTERYDFEKEKNGKGKRIRKISRDC